MNLDPALANEPYCYLTTTGRVSGNLHEIEIWFALVDTTAYLLAGGRDRSDWVRNLVLQPQVTLRIAARTYAATARIVAATSPEDDTARRLLVAKYATPDKPLEAWGRDSLAVAVDLKPGPA